VQENTRDIDRTNLDWAVDFGVRDDDYVPTNLCTFSGSVLLPDRSVRMTLRSAKCPKKVPEASVPRIAFIGCHS
jgi:hypothetical protein